MKQSNPEVFVIRIWNTAGDGSWRGRIEHVNSRRTLLLEDIQQVIPFIQSFSLLEQGRNLPDKPANRILK